MSSITRRPARSIEPVVYAFPFVCFSVIFPEPPFEESFEMTRDEIGPSSMSLVLYGKVRMLGDPAVSPLNFSPSSGLPSSVVIKKAQPAFLFLGENVPQ